MRLVLRYALAALLLFAAAAPARAQWGSLNTLGSEQNKTSGTNNLVITTSAAAEAGNVIVCALGANNLGTVDAETTNWSVTDAAGNNYTRAKEFENGQGTAAAGAACGVFFSKVSTQLNSSSAITFTSGSAVVAKSASCWEFSIGAGNVVTVEASATLADDGADPGSVDATTANAAFLRVRGIATEDNATTAITPTTSWTALTGNQTAGGGAATNMAVRGEFRIVTATGAASDPTFVAADTASCYVALKEAAASVNYNLSPTAAATAAATVALDSGLKPAAAVTAAATTKFESTTSPAAAVTASATTTFVYGQPLDAAASVTASATTALGPGLVPLAAVTASAAPPKLDSTMSPSAPVTASAVANLGPELKPSATATAAATAQLQWGTTLSPSAAVTAAATVQMATGLNPAAAITADAIAALGSNLNPSAAVTAGATAQLQWGTTLSPSAAVTTAATAALGSSVNPSAAVTASADAALAHGQQLNPAAAVTAGATAQLAAGLNPSASVTASAGASLGTGLTPVAAVTVGATAELVHTPGSGGAKRVIIISGAM